MSHSNRLLLLGTGQLGKAVIAQARDSRHIIASTRNPNRIFEFADLGVEPLIMPLPSGEIISHLVRGADVLVTFAPDGNTDAILAPACAEARRLIYISSTGVYGKISGKIDDETPTDSADARMRPRLQAESIWREHGAVVLRAPGIYGPSNGLHIRLAEGTYKMPENGANNVSRIHIDDLATIILAVFDSVKLNDSTYLVGDAHPCTLAEVVSWLCNKMELEMPESVSLSEVSPTLRGNRAVNSERLLQELNIKLKYPSYRDGYAQCLQTGKPKDS